MKIIYFLMKKFSEIHEIDNLLTSCSRPYSRDLIKKDFSVLEKISITINGPRKNKNRYFLLSLSDPNSEQLKTIGSFFLPENSYIAHFQKTETIINNVQDFFTLYL